MGDDEEKVDEADPRAIQKAFKCHFAVQSAIMDILYPGKSRSSRVPILRATSPVPPEAISDLGSIYYLNEGDADASPPDAVVGPAEPEDTRTWRQRPPLL